MTTRRATFLILRAHSSHHIRRARAKDQGGEMLRSAEFCCKEIVANFRRGVYWPVLLSILSIVASKTKSI